jgi:tRNA nucleotidyltransferase/poly(A) polymerase
VISSSDLDPQALEIVHRLQRKGFQSYFVGGCVRDLLVGRKPKDFDIATDAKPQEIRRLIHHAYIIGNRFRLVLARRGEKQYEIATFRKEPETLNHFSNVDENLFGTPKDDAFRRDFTLNALFYDPVSKKLLDFVEGAKDIKQKVIRVIGNPVVRFEEDPIRMLRAIRLGARLGFHLDEETEKGIRLCAHYLGISVPDRTREELLRCLREGAAHKAFAGMREAGVLPYLLPEWAELNDERIPSLAQGSPQFAQDLKAASGENGISKIVSKIFNKKRKSSEITGAEYFDCVYRKIDEMVRNKVTPPSALILTAFLLPPLRRSLFETTGHWDTIHRNQWMDLRWLKEIHQSLRLSNQELAEIVYLVAQRSRLLQKPRPQESKIRSSISRHPAFPHLLTLCKWEAEAFSCPVLEAATKLWEDVHQEAIKKGFRPQPWVIPGPYDRKDARRGRSQGGRGRGQRHQRTSSRHESRGPSTEHGGRHHAPEFAQRHAESHGTPQHDIANAEDSDATMPSGSFVFDEASAVHVAGENKPRRRRRRRRRRGGQNRGAHHPHAPSAVSAAQSNDPTDGSNS